MDVGTFFVYACPPSTTFLCFLLPLAAVVRVFFSSQSTSSFEASFISNLDHSCAPSAFPPQNYFFSLSEFFLRPLAHVETPLNLGKKPAKRDASAKVAAFQDLHATSGPKKHAPPPYSPCEGLFSNVFSRQSAVICQ